MEISHIILEHHQRVNRHVIKKTGDNLREHIEAHREIKRRKIHAGDWRRLTRNYV